MPVTTPRRMPCAALALRGHRRRDGVGEHGPRVADAVAAVAHHVLAVHDHVGDVRAGGGEDHRSGAHPAVRGLSSRRATRSARWLDRDQPTVVPAQGTIAVEAAPWRGGRRRRSDHAEGSRGARASRPRGPPRTGRPPRAGRIPARGAPRHPCRRRAGPMPSARSRSVVGQKHAVVRRPASSFDVGVREVRRVDHGRHRGQQPFRSEQLGGRAPVEALAGVVLARLLRHVHVQRAGRASRDVAHGCEVAPAAPRARSARPPRSGPCRRRPAPRPATPTPPRCRPRSAAAPRRAAGAPRRSAPRRGSRCRAG